MKIPLAYIKKNGRYWHIYARVDLYPKDGFSILAPTIRKDKIIDTFSSYSTAKKFYNLFGYIYNVEPKRHDG